MKKRYDEIMDKVEVTDEMRDRILNNLQEFDFESKSQPKLVRFTSMKKYLSIAACFAVLLVGSFILPRVLDSGQPGEMVIDYSVVEVSSLEELEATVNFDMPEVKTLPFTPDREIYTVYGSDMAEIIYENGNQTARFRKSAGQEDNSGDYNEYSETKEISVGKMVITLKGNGTAFTLALWSDGDFSYSLNLSDGLTVAAWETLIAGIE